MKEHRVWVVLGILAVLGLVGLVIGLGRPRMSGVAQFPSPLQTPTPVMVEPTPVDQNMPTPTAPSEDWPTLTPPPTVTPRPTLPFVPKVTPTPVPTRPPIALTPISRGTPSSQLQSIVYVAKVEQTSEVRALSVDGQMNVWADSPVVFDKLAQPLWGLFLSPGGRYIMVQTAGDGQFIYIADITSGRVFCWPSEQKDCSGEFLAWISDSQLLLRSGEAGIVNVETGKYEKLALPVSDEGYALTNLVAVNSDRSKAAYPLTDAREGKSVLWTMNIDGTNKEPVHTTDGPIVVLSWSPVDEQLFFMTRDVSPLTSTAKLWLLDGESNTVKLLAENIYKPYEWHYRPSWSSNGQYITFVQADNPRYISNEDDTLSYLVGLNVYIVDIKTIQVTKLSSFEDREVSFPIWSPDSRFVAFLSTFVSDVYTPYAEVWVADVTSTQCFAVSGAAEPGSAIVWLAMDISDKEDQ